MFKKLEEKENNYFITSSREYKKISSFKKETVEKAFNFAYDMTFGKTGEHRDHRSGGSVKRKNGEIFINTFQGKLAELAVYNICFKNKIEISAPDFDVYGLGKWDDSDFKYKSKEISVKSTAFFGNLILLETKDWNINAEYLPNNKVYDFHILVRLNPDGKKLMTSNKLMYSNEIDKEKLQDIIVNEDWNFDIPGYISSKDLKEIIKNKYILPKSALLNGRTAMDAENYYVQAGDLKDINELFEELKNIKEGE